MTPPQTEKGTPEEVAKLIMPDHMGNNIGDITVYNIQRDIAEALRQARREGEEAGIRKALEEAAQLAEVCIANNVTGFSAAEVADAIRTLFTSPRPEKGGKA